MLPIPTAQPPKHRAHVHAITGALVGSKQKLPVLHKMCFTPAVTPVEQTYTYTHAYVCTYYTHICFYIENISTPFAFKPLLN